MYRYELEAMLVEHQGFGWGYLKDLVFEKTCVA
jgi:hypothetical protein